MGEHPSNQPLGTNDLDSMSQAIVHSETIVAIDQLI